MNNTQPPKTFVQKLVDTVVLTTVSMLVVGFFAIIYQGVTTQAKTIARLDSEMENIKEIVSGSFAQSKVSQDLIIDDIKDLKKTIEGFHQAMDFQSDESTTNGDETKGDEINEDVTSDVTSKIIPPKKVPIYQYLPAVDEKVLDKIKWYKRDMKKEIEGK